MFQRLFDGNGLLDLPVVMLVLFLAVFVGAVIWVTSRRRGAYDQVASLPLDDEFGGAGR